jgi:hypothetical protein
VCFRHFGFSFALLVPDPDPAKIEDVSRRIQRIFEDQHGDYQQRYASVQELAESSPAQVLGGGGDYGEVSQQQQQQQLVYGELSIPVLAEILSAVGVEENDAFLDIGAGDGALVLGAALMYDNHLRVSRGLEVVPQLVERSQQHAAKLLSSQGLAMAPIEFYLGDIYNSKDQQVDQILQDSTLAVCFATTWSAADQSNVASLSPNTKSLNRRFLPQLSSSLQRMPRGSRIVVIDGRLILGEVNTDVYTWEGDMKVKCPDTAPYSTASLFIRK